MIQCGTATTWSSFAAGATLLLPRLLLVLLLLLLQAPLRRLRRH